MEQMMSPVSEHQITIAPPHWATQVDLLEPVTLYIPGRERATRNNPALTYKAWVLVLICPVTKLVNLQVCEKSDASGILDGFTCMFCEVGIPKVIICDEGSALVKGLSDVEIDIRTLNHEIFTEYGTSFKIIPVSGHNMNGLVERAIRTIQDSLDQAGLRKTKLSATGLQTLCKLVENQFNSLPLGFKKSRDSNNSEILKILTPNMLRHGRINSRSVQGPVRLPGNLSEMSQRLTDIYEAWFRIWSVVAVQKLAERTKWFKPHLNLEVGDIVYFQKDTGSVDSHWVTGKIEEVSEGNDDLVREVVIRYRNFSEAFDRFTTRAARSCVRLFNLDDQNLYDDLHELTERLQKVDGGEDILGLLIHDRNVPTILIDGVNSVDLSTHELLTPGSRSPLSQSQEDLDLLTQTLLDKSVKTPVIVSTEESLMRAWKPTSSLSVKRSRSHSPSFGEHSVLNVSPSSPAKLPPEFGKGKQKCKNCCCISHHRLTDHRSKSKKTPTLAYDRHLRSQAFLQGWY